VASDPGATLMFPRLTATAVAMLALAGSAYAITFGNETKPDPFAPSKMCSTPQMHSWGSYVYGWSSKYDLIFSPRDYPMWVWRCEDSGYVSFPAEFGKFSEAERTRIAAYLAEAKFGPTLKAERGGLSDAVLQHLEKLYALRDHDELFRGYLLRYFAWKYRARPIADEYRKKALALHRKLLDAGGLKGDDLLETLYILGFYSYKFGQVDEAKAYFTQLKDVETIDPETKKPRRGAPYLEGLAREVLEGKADDKVRFRNDAP
jgi:tetratricopeptide (TPR) repeat protein